MENCSNSATRRDAARWTAILLGASLPAVFFTAIVPGCACSGEACVDQLGITVRHADDSPPVYASELVIDGRSVHCPSPVLSTDGTPSAAVTCGDVEVVLREEDLVCRDEPTDGGTMLVCEGNGRFYLSFSIPGAPSEVTITLLEGDSTVAERRIRPRYASREASSCAACNHGSETWVLP
jgi:hypothetical protein